MKTSTLVKVIEERAALLAQIEYADEFKSLTSSEEASVLPNHSPLDIVTAHGTYKFSLRDCRVAPDVADAVKNVLIGRLATLNSWLKDNGIDPKIFKED